MRVAKVNGVHIHFAESGEGPADKGGEGTPTLVFSNSLGTDFRVWDRVAARLAGRFRLIFYDKRGHGLSEAPAGPYQIADHVGDLAGLLDELGVRGAVICGLSVGGMIAQGLAAARPDLVRALVLCDTAHRIGPPASWAQRIDAIRAGGIDALAEPILERWFSAAFRAARPAEVAGWRAMLTRTPVEGYLGTCAAIRDADLTEQAKAIAVPTLCLCGAEDGATPPALVRSLAELIAGARFTEIEGAGHLPCVEAPERVVAAMTDFLKEAALVA